MPATPRSGLPFTWARQLLNLVPSAREQLAQVSRWGDSLARQSNEELRRASLALRYRARSGEPAERLLGEAFALVRESASRTLGLRHYDVQILGGIALQRGCVAEMQTGEGKTLTATLSAYLAAITGDGVHLATANDYLAARDAEWMRPVYEFLGITVGVVEGSTPRPQRRQAYQADVTYGTAKEFGFDFLRDRLAARQAVDTGSTLLARMLGHDGGQGAETIQRGHHFALLDEVDSILIDEARTPLVVSAVQDLPDAERELFTWSAAFAAQLTPLIDWEKPAEPTGGGSYTLTALGRQRLRLAAKPQQLGSFDALELMRAVERAVRAREDFLRDRHYLVRDGEIVIVDEFTGRVAEGRQWRDGLHQALQAKELLTITPVNGDAARITLQAYFRRYARLAGMTGTAEGSKRELRKIYRLRVATIPTNRPPQRIRCEPRIVPDEAAKWAAIVQEVQEVLAAGRAVLIGTRSVDKSERLAAHLQQAGIPHEVLNARRLAQEAEIVAGAGQAGRVTVATNMAGRGTDIMLSEEVRARGGLHVICTELHESRRIDRQLVGRCGRQGDPGTYRQYLALDDDVLESGYGRAGAERWRRRLRRNLSSRAARVFLRAQARIEHQHFRDRQVLMEHERHRTQLHEQMGLDPYLDGPA